MADEIGRKGGERTAPDDPDALRFDEDYREQIDLADGLEVTIRTVRPDDKKLLREGFEKLSIRSRYMRFFGVKKELSEADLRYLTEIDGIDHVAIGALHTLSDGTEEGVGIARFIRIPDSPEVAEPAVVVADRMQRKGVGTALLVRLAAAAQERGIHRFRCEVLADNQAMRRLLEELGPDTRYEEDEAEVVRADIEIPPGVYDRHVKAAISGSSIYTIFNRAARGIVSVALREIERIAEE
jgi:RimJ/RimL family protein N-acetyltransferase